MNDTDHTDTTASTDTTAPDGPPFADVPLAWDELRDAVTAAGDGLFLATADGTGRPHVAFVQPGWGDERLWISSFASSRKVRNLTANPLAALTCTPSPELNVLIRAEARLVDTIEETRQLWEDGVLPYDPSMFFSGPDDPEARFIELRPTTASIHTLWPSPHRRWSPA